MKCHVIKKNNTCRWPSSYLRSYSIQVLLVVLILSHFTNDSMYEYFVQNNC